MSNLRCLRSRTFRATWGRIAMLAFLGAQPLRAQADTGSPAVRVVEALIDAFNRHDPAEMMRLVSDSLELYYFDADGQAQLSVRGATALQDQMEAYFLDRPSVASRIVEWIPGTRFVAIRERIRGGASSIGVFEIHEGLIRRAWYYPAEP